MLFMSVTATAITVCVLAVQSVFTRYKSSGSLLFVEH